MRLLVYVPLLAWIVYVEQMGWGLARKLGLSGWVEFLLTTVVVLDFFDYVWHRANHRIAFLWRFHKAHHADNDLDVFTALRFHPGELLISALVKATWIIIWGPSAFAWFLFEASVSLCAQMHHSNIDLPDKLERKFAAFIVTPRFHAAHHLVDRQFGDRNFSTIFSFWDRFFCHWHPVCRKTPCGRSLWGCRKGAAKRSRQSNCCLNRSKAVTCLLIVSTTYPYQYRTDWLG